MNEPLTGALFKIPMGQFLKVGFNIEELRNRAWEEGKRFRLYLELFRMEQRVQKYKGLSGR